MSYRTGYEYEIVQRQQAALRTEANNRKMAQAVAKANPPHRLLRWRRTMGEHLIGVGKRLAQKPLIKFGRWVLPKPKAPLV
jgi:hypothetical protein